MSLQLMRLVDRYLGVLACWVLTWHRRTLGRLVGRRPVTPPRAVLLIKLWGLGSILLTGPVQRALRRAYPETRLCYLTFEQNRWAVEAQGLADEVWTLSTQGLGRALRDVLAFWRHCRRVRVDLCLDLEFFSRLPAVLSYLSGAARRVGYWSRGIYTGDLHTDRCNFNAYRHVTEIFCALAEAVGVPCEPEVPVPPQVTPEDAQAVAAKLAAVGCCAGETFVALSPNVSDLGAPLRRWPEANWVALANRLATELGLRSVFLGAPGDAAYVANLVARCAPAARVCSLAGQTSLGELAAVVAAAGALVACASGPVPLAECLGTPTVALFGTETPVLYGLRGDRHRTLYKAPYCSPCLSVYNEKIVDFVCDNRCMRDITVDEVLAAVAQIVRPAAGSEQA